MPENANVDNPLFLSIGSGFVGVLVTLIGGSVGALMASRREHATWLRDKRVEAYVGYLTAADLYLESGTTNYWEVSYGSDEDRQAHRLRTTKFREELARSQSAVVLLGPEATRRVAGEYHLSIGDALSVSQEGSIENELARDASNVTAARALMLGVMNRVLDVRP